MGFFSNQLRSVIEWKDPSPEVLIWRWDGGSDELKNASKLLINPGQAAIFVYQGQVQAIHDYPGLFELRTANLPFWTTITKIMQGFVSEHKANIYFVRLTDFLNQKWGTKAPIKYDDPKYKFPVGLRAFGNFSFKICDPRKFFTEISSNREIYTIAEIRNVIVDRVLTPLADLFAESGYSYSEIDKKRMELSNELRKRVADIFPPLGFELTDFRIENTDFDDDTKRRINKIADQMAEAQAVKALGDIDGGSMNNYTRVEQLKALNAASHNPGGLPGMGVGFGAAMGLGQTMGAAFQPMPVGPAAGPTVACPGCQSPMAANAKFCPNCGKPNTAGQAACVACKKPMPAGQKFCPECGAPQSAACPGCQKPIAAGAKFCPECGYKMS
ncbi:MAG: SPFH domain-containing protein [Candidatus Riflebacteria bacterium]|nr:SPFH domain-containing protein [Candidatus Riflebacteria bacterium]